MSEQVLFEGRIVIETQGAQSSVQVLEDKIQKLGSGGTKGAEGVKNLSSAVNDSVKAVGGLKMGASAFSAAMRGDFVGACAMGSAALKNMFPSFSGLSAGMMALVGGATAVVSAAAIAVKMYFDSMKAKADETIAKFDAWKQSMKDVRAEADALAELTAKLTHSDPVSRAEKEAGETENVAFAEYKAKNASNKFNDYVSEAYQLQKKKDEWVNLDGNKAEDFGYNSRLAELQKLMEIKAKEKDIWDARISDLKTSLKEQKETIVKGQAELNNAIAPASIQEDYSDAKSTRAETEKAMVLDSIKDPVKRLEAEKGLKVSDWYGLKGKTGGEADSQRANLEREIYEIEKRISEEKERQAKASQDALKSAQDAVNLAKKDILDAKPTGGTPKGKGATGRFALGGDKDPRSVSERFLDASHARRDAMNAGAREHYDFKNKNWVSQSEMDKRKQDKWDKKHPLEAVLRKAEEHLANMDKTLAG